MVFNKKGQAGNVLIAIFLTLIVGIVLYSFSPIISDFRADLISNLDADANPLYEIALYALMPIVWFLYMFASFLFIAITGQASRGAI